MPILNIVTTTQSYKDQTATSNPMLRVWDWTRKLLGIMVDRPVSNEYIVDPSATLTVFNGQRSTSIDNTTSFTLTLSPLSSQRYRLSKVAGTSPAFRTARSLNMTGNVMAITALANGTLQVSLGSGALLGTDFGTIQVGDQVWIPGTATGDTAGPFDGSNQGLWSVLGVAPVSAVANRLLTLKRVESNDSTGVGETVTPSASTQFQAFSATGVQSKDSADFASLLWSQGLRKTFMVDRVTPDWFEFLSNDPLPLDATILPTATGLIFYTSVKRYVRIEADQDVAVQFNGDTSQSVRVSPIAPQDPVQMGFVEKFGPTWSLSIINRSTSQVTLYVFAAE